jgi:hypothetical protein
MTFLSNLNYVFEDPHRRSEPLLDAPEQSDDSLYRRVSV